ncbi:MAG: caspase family protein, partial [Piscinibacter sp.]|nr:caspase family protein [Piscinibacter sp.]
MLGDILRAFARVWRQGAALLAAAALALPAARAQAPAEERLALVIGNGAYKQAPLRNAVADARLMDAALREAGFEVLRAENATLREMRRLVRDFGERLQRSQGVGLFYFAGHGVQLNGENYLVSVDSDIRHEDEVPDDSISAQLVLEKMESARNRMNILVLDACRNNPFASRTRGTTNGLAVMNAPAGTLVAYATAPGSVAFDGSGSNGLYTRHLAQQLREPGLRVEEVFKRVRAAVRRESNNRQTPWENTALVGEFFFRPAATVAAAPPAPTAPPAPARPGGTAPAEAAAFELAFWDSIKNSTRRAELEEYLKQYPQGRFAGLVRSRLAGLERSAAAPSAAAPPAATAATAATAAPSASTAGRISSAAISPT